jgi:hypothetical protein
MSMEHITVPKASRKHRSMSMHMNDEWKRTKKTKGRTRYIAPTRAGEILTRGRPRTYQGGKTVAHLANSPVAQIALPHNAARKQPCCRPRSFLKHMHVFVKILRNDWIVINIFDIQLSACPLQRGSSPRATRYPPSLSCHAARRRTAGWANVFI